MFATTQRDRLPWKHLFLSSVLIVGAALLPLMASAQQTRIVASDGDGTDNPVDENGDQFGNSVAISGNGERAIVGSWTDNINGNADAGSAYIYARQSDGSWSREAKLTSTDEAEFDRFSSDPSSGVSINQDGTVALVGALTDGSGGTAYVFNRDDSDTWSQETALTVSGSSLLGISVSISADGQRVLVGATGSNEDQGEAYVFTRSSEGVWTQEATLFPDDGAGVAEFGRTVSLSPDGARALVGSPATDVNGTSDQGAGYVFERDQDGNWSQEAALTADDGAEADLLGLGASISGDASNAQRAVLGALGADVDGNTDQGRAYVYVRDGSTWTQEDKVTAASNATFPNLGNDVAISTDATRVLVGTPKDDPSGGDTNSGSAYVFDRGGGTWSQGPMITAQDSAAFDEFGTAVAISGNGERAFVGARFNDISGTTDQGSVYALGPSSLPVELADFTARRDGRAAVLAWRTLSEANNARFEVQHRAPDASSYATIGRVEGAGTTTDAQRYRFRTQSLTPGTHRFRLRQVDIDGSTTLAGSPQVVTIQAERALTLRTTGSHPVQTRTTLRFTVTQDGPAVVALYNTLGQRVKVLRNVKARTGQAYTVSLTTEGLASGMYFVRLQAPSGTQTRRIVVAR